MKPTRTFRLKKLVRDDIVGLTEAEGGTVQSRRLSPDERLDKALDKLGEELGELRTAGNDDDRRKELADIRDMVRLIGGLLLADDSLLDSLSAERQAHNGGYSDWRFIETVTLPADSQWAEYYAGDPERFPEITP